MGLEHGSIVYAECVKVKDAEKEIEIPSLELDDHFLRLKEIFNCRVVISEEPFSPNTPKGNVYINYLCIRILPVRNSFGHPFRIDKIIPKFILKKRFNNFKEIETEISNIKSRMESMFPVEITYTFDFLEGVFDFKINLKDVIIGVKYEQANLVFHRNYFFPS